MGEPIFGGIDAGTMGEAVALFDHRGRIIASADRHYLCVSERPGWVEQDMNAVWQALARPERGQG